MILKKIMPSLCMLTICFISISNASTKDLAIPDNLFVTQITGKYDSKTINKHGKTNALAFEHITRDAAHYACDSFLNGRLDQLDGNGGDTACQIRTHKVTQLYNNPYSHHALHEELSLLRKIPAQITQDQSMHTIPTLSDDAKFLTLMSLVHTFKPNSLTDTIAADNAEQAIAQTLKIHALTPKAFQLFMAAVRVELNKMTNTHILKVCQQTQDQALIEGIAQKASNGGTTTHPCYIGFKALLNIGKQEQMPIVIKSTVIRDETSSSQNRSVYPYKALFVNNNGIYEMVNLTDDKAFAVMDKAALVTSGLTYNGHADLESEINILLKQPTNEHIPEDIKQALEYSLQTAGIQTALLANAAKHPQFHVHDQQIDFSALPNLKAEYTASVECAERDGYCKDNMTTFRIKHIYPQIVREALNSNSSKVDTKTASSHTT